jgi:hypothetical protein
VRGWERGEKRLPPGYGLDTSDGGTWALRRPDGTAVSYSGVWEATREAVERAAREDHARRKGGGKVPDRPGYAPNRVDVGVLRSPAQPRSSSHRRCLAAPLDVVGKRWEVGVSVSPARGSGRKETRSHAREGEHIGGSPRPDG